MKPEYLYKYRPLNRHTLDMILFNEAYFSLPKDFNDPFDCNIIPDLVYSEGEKKEFIEKLKENGNLNQEEYINLVENTKKTFEHGFQVTNQNTRNNLRIFCLSEVNNNVMMYSHYADSHKGICLEFHVENDPFFGILVSVHYENKVPVFHPFLEDLKSILKELPKVQLLTKSCSWCYEKEWRIIMDGPEPSIYRFPPQILTSIIFGYRTPPTDRILIDKIVRDREFPVQLKEAVRKENSFELEIRQID